MGGRRLGSDDERDLFPEMLRLAEKIRAAAVMIENVRGLLTRRFALLQETRAELRLAPNSRWSFRVRSRQLSSLLQRR